MNGEVPAHLELYRWQLSSQWAVPLDRVVGQTPDELRACVARLRPRYTMPLIAERLRAPELPGAALFSE
ncbi:UNVERIFIED_ORG: hypothetical protein E4P37_07900 [Bacillus sp. AZ43]